eukprot:381249-Prymnesium_polylepis.1
MQPEARSVVGYSLDCLWATGSIVRRPRATDTPSASAPATPALSEAACGAGQPPRTPRAPHVSGPLPPAAVRAAVQKAHSAVEGRSATSYLPRPQGQPVGEEPHWAAATP